MTSQRAHLVFDLDGTISDPAVGIHRSINYALAHFGFPTIDQVTTYIGPPLDETFAAIISTSSPDRIAELVTKYRERYSETGYAENVLYPGIAEALHNLARRNAPLGLCTSKRADFAERILELFQIRDYFRFVHGGDVGVRKDQQLASLLASGTIASNSLVIGDRDIDVFAARANGLRSVSVLWGYGTPTELHAAQPDHIVQSPEELPSLADLL